MDTDGLKAAIRKAIEESGPRTQRWEEVALVDGRWTPREVADACDMMQRQGHAALTHLSAGRIADAVETLALARREESRLVGSLAFTWAHPFKLATHALRAERAAGASFPHPAAELQAGALRLALADRRKEIAQIEALVGPALEVIHAAVTAGTWREDLPSAMRDVLDARRALEEPVLSRGTHLGRLYNAAAELCDANARRVMAEPNPDRDA